MYFGTGWYPFGGPNPAENALISNSYGAWDSWGYETFQTYVVNDIKPKSDDFATNNWTFENNEQGNWTIFAYMGNTGGSARFGANPPMMDYEYRLISQEFDASKLTQVILSYDIKSMFIMPGTNHMSIEVRPIGGDWINLVTYNSGIPVEGDWQHDEFDISSYVAVTHFRIASWSAPTCINESSCFI